MNAASSRAVVLVVPLVVAAFGVVLTAEQPGQDDAVERLSAVARTVPGTVSLYAKHLTNGREVALDADRLVRTASTIKLPILCALEALVASGRVRWDETIRLKDSDKVSGSGVVHELGEGTALTLRDLATLMIVVSDNTATNLVLERISADAVNDYLDALGLTRTRALRKIRGDGTALVPPSGWSRAGKDPRNEPFGIGVSTAREMVTLLERLHQGTVVNAAASKDVLGLLGRQQYKDGIGRRAGNLVVQSKSGALDHLRSDVGIVHTPSGPIAMAVTIDGLATIDYSPDNAGNELIWQLSEVVQDVLGRR